MSHCTLLYVEDDQHVRQYFSEFLSRYCKTLYQCESAEEALALYQEHRPDIILLDINLPGINGIDFASVIREQDETTRILISTAYTDNAFLLKAVELQLTRYLVKPITSTELFSALEKCLDEIETLTGKLHHIVLGEGFVYDRKSKLLKRHGQKIDLRKKEVELLEFFLDRPGETVSYEILESAVWNDEVMSKDAIRSQIKNLRHKTYNALIENVTGIGYRIHPKNDGVPA